MKRVVLLATVFVSCSIQAMDTGGQGDPTENVRVPEVIKASSECTTAIMAIYRLASNASNKLLSRAWDVHYEKYRREHEEIEAREKAPNPDVIAIQRDYFMLKHRAQKRAQQNPFEMLTKTYWKGAMAAVSVTTAVAVPLTYMASYEIYKRMKKTDDEEEDFGEGSDENRVADPCVHGCVEEVPA